MFLDKLGEMRGFLFKKFAESFEQEEERKKAEEALPGFGISKPAKRIVEFPSIEDITKLNLIYPLIEPFAYVNIKWNNEGKELMYFVLEPKLSEEEEKTLKKITEGLIELVDVNLSSIKDLSKAIEYLETNIRKVIKEFGMSLTNEQYIKFMYYSYRNLVGLNQIEPLMEDPNIEDISCDGVGVPLYIIHRKYGSLKTNLVFKYSNELTEFVVKLSERCGRYVSYAEPILDGTLSDGSRVSATLASDVATRGATFTIRKFSEKPFSPIEQMEFKTADSQLLAYFWYLMQYGISMLVVGGVATGKTSFLNSLCMFIPPEAKVVSIEDTRELRIPNEHWIPTLSRTGFGIPAPSGEKYGGVSLFDLLKESFRQNPDYVIVGEVRGNEAYVMFQGMSSGHPSLSTMHAGSVDTLIKRLTTPPIELSPTLIESLDVVVVMIHAKEKGKSARRIKEIVEIERVDPKTADVKSRTVFRWNPESDTYEKTDQSIKVEKIALAKGGNVVDAFKEIETRKIILDTMKQKGIKDYLEVTRLVNLYYKEPSKVFETLGMSPEMEVKIPVTVPIRAKPQPQLAQAEATIEKEKKRFSIWDLLGFKFLRET